MSTHTKKINRWQGAILMAAFIAGLGLMLIWISTGQAAGPLEQAQAPQADEYIVLAWNDLGMHCYNRDFKDLGVLPPVNTLWAQVIKIGDPPQVINTGVSVRYFFTDNTYSVGKSNFWDYDQQLFGVYLSNNVGLGLRPAGERRFRDQLKPATTSDRPAKPKAATAKPTPAEKPKSAGRTRSKKTG